MDEMVPAPVKGLIHVGRNVCRQKYVSSGGVNAATCTALGDFQ